MINQKSYTMKFAKVLIIGMIVLFATALACSAQTPPDPTQPPDWSVNYASLPAMAAFALVATAFINKVGKVTGSVLKAIISWVTAIGITFLGRYFHWGIVADSSILETILTGIGIGFIANLGYDNTLIGYILELIKLKLPKKTT